MFLTTAVVVKEAQVGTTATTTATNAVPLFGGKKGMREMLAFWKKYEKEEKEKLKRAEKEKLEKLKEEDERREARRQARKLNFLIEQTEIFSHFVGQKLDSQMKGTLLMGHLSYLTEILPQLMVRQKLEAQKPKRQQNLILLTMMMQHYEREPRQTQLQP